jgi:hypothetical protein
MEREGERVRGEMDGGGEQTNDRRSTSIFVFFLAFILLFWREGERTGGGRSDVERGVPAALTPAWREAKAKPNE